MRNEKVIPIGTPASKNPIKIGMEEQEQKGVRVPKRDAKILPTPSFLPDNIFLIRWRGR